MDNVSKQNMDNVSNMVLREIRSFIGPRGEKVDELTLVDGLTGTAVSETRDKTSTEKLSTPDIMYFGVFIMPAAVRNQEDEEIGYLPQEIRFPIESVSNRVEAINNFMPSLQKFVKKLQEQQKSNPIIVPDEATVQSINKMSNKNGIISG